MEEINAGNDPAGREELERQLREFDAGWFQMTGHSFYKLPPHNDLIMQEPEPVRVFFGIKQKVFTNHANRLSFRPETDTKGVLAHLRACELVLGDDYEAYKDHCIKNNLQWYSTWIKNE